jgi:Zn-dependent alcohol dehydrogenase
LQDINESGFIDLEELKVAVAFLLEEESFPMGMMGGDATSTSATSSVEDLFAAIDVAKDGRIDFDSLITHTMPLEDINKAFDLMHSGESIRSVVLY